MCLFTLKTEAVSFSETSRKKYLYISITNTNRLMQFSETITVYYENPERVNTQCGQSGEFRNVKAAVTTVITIL
jgi:hypothetical protein